MRGSRVLGGFIVLGMLLSSVAHARWATLEDAATFTEFSRLRFDIRKDGSFEYRSEYQDEIRNDKGRTDYGTTHTYYDPKSSKVKIDEAKTINGKDVTKVPKELIEDKPLASALSGFDELNQITVAFPKVEIGSKLYQKTTTEMSVPTVPGFFSTRIALGQQGYLGAFEGVFESEMPLYFEKSDPENKIEVVSEQNNGRYRITITLKSPLFQYVLDEPDAYLSVNRQTWFMVSSAKDYDALGKYLTGQFEERIRDPLPTSLKVIVAEAEKKTSVEDRINTVTSYLANSFRYQGDWRSVRGMIVPRTLAEIDSTRFGDCKDFSIATVAMLRALGYDAKVAIVYRGALNVPLPSMPEMGSFNHAIVYARINDKDYWIDPTNVASFARGIFSDIQGRDALLLDGEKPRLASIPRTKASDGVSNWKLTIVPSGRQEVEISSESTHSGQSAVQWTGLGLSWSNDAIKNQYASVLSGNRVVSKQEIHDVDLTSRTVKDVHISGKIWVKNYCMMTTAGTAFPLEYDSIRQILDVDPAERVSDLEMGFTPSTLKNSFHLAGSRLVGKPLRGCKLDSPWINVERTMFRQNGGYTVNDVYEFKEQIIPNSDLKSQAFLDFQKKLRDCFLQVAVVFKENHKPAKSPHLAE